MSRRVGNTIVPRNHVVRASASRRGGVHERGRTAERMGSRAKVREMAEDWREDLAFEREVRVELNDDE
ncbi:hypothetical protein [Arenicella xantha]|uniref:Uncharacterized protein n=1 Tax=Arenicella xantha TaxID=644221 RepID=A0A395JJR8_9GAMM|nr:hypothetical protein [Arenicella xantha]RBP51026.1 hypothetical protein DFR28_102445 [Arenicella xantha]